MRHSQGSVQASTLIASLPQSSTNAHRVSMRSWDRQVCFARDGGGGGLLMQRENSHEQRRKGLSLQAQLLPALKELPAFLLGKGYEESHAALENPFQ